MSQILEMADVGARAADTFVSTFYKYMDRSRHKTTQLYKDSSKVVWNGTPMSGLSALNEFFLSLPPSDCQIQSYDCHPIPHSDRSILIHVSGSIKYENEYRKTFSETFVLAPSTDGSGTFFISSDVFRFV